MNEFQQIPRKERGQEVQFGVNYGYFTFAHTEFISHLMKYSEQLDKCLCDVYLFFLSFIFILSLSSYLFPSPMSPILCRWEISH